MPFDRVTYDMPKAAVLSPRGMAEWLRTQDLDTKYDYMSNGDCLIARFLRYKGMDLMGVGGDYWHEKTGPDYTIPKSVGKIAHSWPCTYRNALAIAETLVRQ